MVKVKNTPKAQEIGTIRVHAKTLSTYIKNSNTQDKASWKKISTKELKTNPKFKILKERLANILQAVKLFKANRNFKALIDTKDPTWLKGSLTKKGLEKGARINILPNKKVLTKAFSLFSPQLTFHDQDSHDHWDVIYQNKGGTYSYLYTKEKQIKHKKAKYSKVELFNSSYKTLNQKLTKKLKTTDLKNPDPLILAMYTLLKTNMRIGNLTYYKAHKHKGLTTLKKSDITINSKSNSKQTVTFNYIGKDGVPIQITKIFSNTYIKAMQHLLKQRKQNEFVFATNNKKPLPEHKFKELFKELTNHEFYPHIVRSFTATKMLKQSLKKLKQKKISTINKQEKQTILLTIAHELGHKKFNKKTQEWQDSFSVTVNNYIRPDLMEQLNSITK